MSIFDEPNITCPNCKFRHPQRLSCEAARHYAATAARPHVPVRYTESPADFLRALAQNDYSIDGHLLPTGQRLVKIAGMLDAETAIPDGWEHGT